MYFMICQINYFKNKEKEICFQADRVSTCEVIKCERTGINTYTEVLVRC